MRDSLKRLTILSAAGCAVAAAAPLAQEGPPIVLAPVRVTGEGGSPGITGYRPPAEAEVLGLPAPLREVPVTVNTLPAQVLEDLSATRLRDVIDYVPGVSAIEVNGGTGDIFKIRGFDVFNVQLNGLRRRAGTDQSKALYNIERVEILKGPAGFESGIVEPGGVVNFVTKKPLDSFGFEAFAEHGSYNRTEMGFDVTGPLPGGRGLSYRAIAAGEKAGSFRDTFDRRRLLLAPSLAWRPREGSSVLLELEYNYLDQPYDRGVFYLEDAGLDDDFAPVNRSLHEPDDELDSHQGRAALYVDQRLTDILSVRASGEYLRENGESTGARNPDLTRLYLPDTNSFSGDPIVERSLVEFDGEQSEFLTKGELVAQGSTGPLAHFGLAGVSWSHYDSEITGRDGQTEWPINALAPRYGTDPVVVGSAEDGVGRDFLLRQDGEFAGAYGQYKVDVYDRLHLIGGLRYDWARFGTQNTDNINVEPIEPSDTYDDSGISYRLGVGFDLNDQLTVFAGYSTAFEPQDGTLRGGGRPDALETESFETGFKMDLFDDRLALTASIFQITQENIAEDDPDNLPGETFVDVIGEVRVRGAELYATGQVTDDFALLAGAAYLDSEITESEEGQKGNELYSVPKIEASLFGKYDLTKLGLAGLSAGLGVVYVGEREGDNDNSFELPDYWRIDTGLYYEWRSLTAKLTVENLLDEDYYTASQNRRDNITPGAPRIVTAGIGVRF